MHRASRRTIATLRRVLSTAAAATSLLLAAGCLKPVPSTPPTNASASTPTPGMTPGSIPPTVYPSGTVPVAPTPTTLPPSNNGVPQPGFNQPGVVPGVVPGVAGGDAVPAQAGVGAKGRSLDNEKGVLVTPAKTLFAARERVVFEIQIPQALQLFKATNGQPPASHDEFMQRVIGENAIQLPMLPAGQRYQYDPATEQLMVIR